MTGCPPVPARNSIIAHAGEPTSIFTMVRSKYLSAGGKFVFVSRGKVTRFPIGS
jgi:hypothetical protein